MSNLQNMPAAGLAALAASAERKFQRVLESTNVSMTLRQLKSLDTIEITGTAENGKERVLINEIKREFGVDALRKSEAASILLPFIPAGVLKSRTKDRVYYTYFEVDDCGKNSDTFRLTIADHQLKDGIFKLRYVAEIQEIPKTLPGGDSKITMQGFSAGGFPHFLENVTDEEMLREMSGEEMELLRNSASPMDSEDMIMKEVYKIINYLLTTFRAINFLNERKRTKPEPPPEADPENPLEKDSGSKTGEKKRHTAIEDCGDNIRVLKMGDYYTFRSTKPIGQSGQSFTRRTEQWLVTGHVRHYKNGKTVYIKPYYKGPGRDKGRIGKTVIKVAEERKKP